MRPLRALAVYIVVVFIGGALLAPWLYWLAQAFAHEFPKIAQSPFHRFVSRSVQGLALLGIWPLLKSRGADSLKDAGLVTPAGQWGKLVWGCLFGLVSLVVAVGVVLVCGARHFQLPAISPAHFAGKIVRFALTATVVAVLEEVLFRGALFGLLRKIFHWIFALVVSSIVYGLAHFMQAAEMTGAMTWLSGLELLPRMLRGFVDLGATIPGFFNLTLAGVLLGLAYQRTGNLCFSIGLHAVWVFLLKSYGLLTASVGGASTWWWGSSRLVDGWFALPVLAVTLLIFARSPIGRQKGFHT
jgi:membrane protease YdiL (CAAX protease family)